jgi:hypothetical protein
LNIIMPKSLILVYISIVHGVGGTEVGGVMVAVFGMGEPFVRGEGRGLGTAPTGGGDWLVELLHIKLGAELIICIEIVLAHNDENT